MTHDGRPDLDRAIRETAESKRRAEQDQRRAREQARAGMSLAARLRQLREENGFEALFREAFGGRGG